LIVQPWQLFFTHGVLTGLGASLVFFPSVFLPTQWFMRRRGLATGIAVSGSGFGGLAMGPLTRALIDLSGYRWCLRYLAIGSFAVLLLATMLARENKLVKAQDEVVSITSQSQRKKQKIIDVSLLKRPEFLALALMTTLATFGFMAPFYFLPSYSTFIGLTESDGALFVGIGAGMNALGKITLGYAADRLGRINTLFACVCLSGLSVLLVWVFAKSYGVLLLFIILYGLNAGGFVSLFPVVTAEFVGKY
jgi:predicted MFS family arabinose efflux permease